MLQQAEQECGNMQDFFWILLFVFVKKRTEVNLNLKKTHQKQEQRIHSVLFEDFCEVFEDF